MSDYRLDKDSLGEVRVPAERLWGAQTQRSIENFPIGRDRFVWGRRVIRALGLLKKSAALANGELGELPQEKVDLIVKAADEVISGELDAEFPLVVWQTGSGTQSNMNVNEVIANRANQLAGRELGSKKPVHPNDDVNRSQSSNDTFPTAMHIAAVEEVRENLIPAAEVLRNTLASKGDQFTDVVMVGRTHLQDATPVRLSQVFSGWVAQIDDAIASIERALPGVCKLAIGGTAVGTGLNSQARFGDLVAEKVAEETGRPFVAAENKFAALSAHDDLVDLSGSMRRLAVALFKVANDIRMYAMGPRAGIAELKIPENEPGSSIMPGKINPTQSEAMTMVCVQVLGNDTAVAFAGTQGAFQLNVFKPVMLHNVLESASLLADASRAFNDHCAVGIEPDREVIRNHLENSLMLVTALTPHIGYEKSAEIALKAFRDNKSLKEVAVELGYVEANDFDKWVRPEDMTKPTDG
ncbi:MAG TPA: class II fumarate hydratase [Actinomycetota bacterium]|nr:class II fumarate hydratase [Actinomycetota bacterium]